jgi:hypothetical protein
MKAQTLMLQPAWKEGQGSLLIFGRRRHKLLAAGQTLTRMQPNTTTLNRADTSRSREQKNHLLMFGLDTGKRLRPVSYRNLVTAR